MADLLATVCNFLCYRLGARLLGFTLSNLNEAPDGVESPVQEQGRPATVEDFSDEHHSFRCSGDSGSTQPVSPSPRLSRERSPGWLVLPLHAGGRSAKVCRSLGIPVGGSHLALPGEPPHLLAPSRLPSGGASPRSPQIQGCRTGGMLSQPAKRGP